MLSYALGYQEICPVDAIYNYPIPFLNLILSWYILFICLPATSQDSSIWSDVRSSAGFPNRTIWTCYAPLRHGAAQQT